MHRKIKRFGMEGTVAESRVVRLLQEQEPVIMTEMRDKGYVPVLGLGPYLSLEFDWEAEQYKFVISAYGVFVGSEGVRQWDGVELTSGRLLERPTQKTTSETS